MSDRCEECGSELVFASPDNHFQAEQYECPLCNANDEIERLRGIIASETYRTNHKRLYEKMRVLYEDVRHNILKQVRVVLLEQGELMGLEPIKTCRPTHGLCCMCQDCGYGHDECVCDHNELLEALDVIIKVNLSRETMDKLFDRTVDRGTFERSLKDEDA